MAILRPVTKTLISSSSWGIPITDEVNRLTPLVDGAKAGAWQAMALANGWANFNGGYSTAMYRKRGDMVDCKGTISGGATGSVFASLPVGFTPASNVQPTCRDGYINLAANGALSFTGTAAFTGITSFLFSFPTS